MAATCCGYSGRGTSSARQVLRLVEAGFQRGFPFGTGCRKQAERRCIHPWRACLILLLAPLPAMPWICLGYALDMPWICLEFDVLPWICLGFALDLPWVCLLSGICQAFVRHSSKIQTVVRHSSGICQEFIGKITNVQQSSLATLQ